MKKKTAKKSPLDQFKTEMVVGKSRPNPANVRLHPVLEKHLGYCLYKVAVKFRAIVDEALADQFLIAPQFGILNILKSSESLNQVTLGNQMGVDKATVVKLIDGLEKRGFLIRVASETDRREKFLKITPKGVKYIDQLIPKMKQLEHDFLGPLTDAEKRLFMKAIPKLMQGQSD